MNGLVNFTPASQVLAEQNPQPAEPIINTSSLANHLRTLWREARQAKINSGVEKRMLRNMRMFRNEYEPEKLVEIAKMGGAKTFLPMVNIKCRAGSAWVKDTYFQPDSMPFGLDPTPIPEISEEEKQQLISESMTYYQAVVQQEVMTAQMSGMPPNPALMQQKAMDFAKKLKDQFEQKVMDIAKKNAEKVERQLNDKLTEGGFYEALKDSSDDIMIQPSAVIKGPVYVRKKVPQVGQGTVQIVDKVVETYSRVNPMNIYPAPESSGINSGYLFELMTITAKELSELRGVDGYNAASINNVLQRYRSKGYRESMDNFAQKQAVEGKPQTTSTSSSTVNEIFDMLCFWGNISGEMLSNDLGMGDVTLDPNTYYSVCTFLIDDQIIRTLMNYDPFGHIPYSKASFIEVKDSFWGFSLADILYELQAACNALARAIVNNSAIASGPLVERNIDRIPNPAASRALAPWMIFDSTEAMMNSSPAFRFYQPTLNSDKLVLVLQAFMKMADELSGIPAYAHGDVTVGGAGRTASGLSMLSNNANRGIKAVIANIDKGIVEDLVKRQFYIDLINQEYNNNLPDVNIVAKGSMSLLEKEQRNVRLNEMLQITSNPIDTQIMGEDGRKYMVEEVAKAHGIDPDKLFAEKVGLEDIQNNPAFAGMAPGMAPGQQIPMGMGQAQNMKQGVSQFNGANGR